MSKEKPAVTPESLITSGASTIPVETLDVTSTDVSSFFTQSLPRRRVLAGFIAVGLGVGTNILAQTGQGEAATTNTGNTNGKIDRKEHNTSPSTPQAPSSGTLQEGQVVTVQPTPTPSIQEEQANATLEYTKEQIQGQQIQNWVTPLTEIVTPATVVGGGLLTIGRYLKTQHEKNQQEEEKLRLERETIMQKADTFFHNTLAEIGNEETKIIGMINLSTLLQEKNKDVYERFYPQIFVLLTTYLRMRKVDKQNPSPDHFYTLVIPAFLKVVPLLREQLGLDSFPEKLTEDQKEQYNAIREKEFDASGVHLEGANLTRADLSGLVLNGAFLVGANLFKATLKRTSFSAADLTDAQLNETNAQNASFFHPDLIRTKTNGTKFQGATFEEADLTNARMNVAEKPSGMLVPTDLANTNIEKAKTLQGVYMGTVTNLDPQKVSACKRLGATFDRAKAT